MTEAAARFTVNTFVLLQSDAVTLRRTRPIRAPAGCSEKAGFEFEGRLRSSAVKDGQVLDQMLYSRIKSING